MVICGIHLPQGSSGAKKLNNLANNFERGKVDTFVINSLALGTFQKTNPLTCNKLIRYLQFDLGTIERIEIGHDGTGIGSAWFLSYVIIDCPDTAKKYYFYADQW